MAKVHWTDEALDQLDQTIAYISVFNPAAADRIGATLYRKSLSVGDFPYLGRPARGGTRELATVPPYIIQYDVVGDLVSILRVRHDARLPETDRCP